MFPMAALEISPPAYATTKEQLHRPARTAIDAGAGTDALVRASWMSDETCPRIQAFLDALARRRQRKNTSPESVS
jgi:enoyl-CoA hydratase